MKYAKYFLSAVLLFSVSFVVAQTTNTGSVQIMPVRGQEMMGPQMMGPQMMGPMQGGPMMGGQGGPGMEGQQYGPPPEVSPRELRRMQRGASGLEKILQMVKKQMDKARAKGVVPNEECTAVAQELSDIITTIKSATIDNWMEVGPQMMNMGTIMPKIDECVRSWAMVDQAKKVFKQADTFVAKLGNQLTRIEAKATKAGLESLVNEIKTAISGLKDDLNNIKEQFKIDTSVVEELQGWFESARETQEKIVNLNQVIPLIKKASGFLKTAVNKEKIYAKKIAVLEKKGEDIAEARDLLAQLQEARADIEAAVSEKDKDYETIGEAMANYFEIVSQLNQILGGRAQIMPVPFAIPGVEVPTFQVPKSFNMFMQGPPMGGPEGGPQGSMMQQGPMMQPPMMGPQMMQPQPMGPQLLERLTPQQKEALKANILNLFKIR
jgi:hypothetical protein